MTSFPERASMIVAESASLLRLKTRSEGWS
jgi:hypothetical protein